jgi:hypothetical protein
MNAWRSQDLLKAIFNDIGQNECHLGNEVWNRLSNNALNIFGMGREKTPCAATRENLVNVLNDVETYIGGARDRRTDGDFVVTPQALDRLKQAMRAR